MTRTSDFNPVVDAPPYRPFQLMGHVAVSLLVMFVVWFPLALLTSGFAFGPAEPVRFSSLSEARQHVLRDYGVAWPGSTVRAEPTADGYVVERRWLWWSEVAVSLEPNLATDYASHRLGSGNTIQHSLVAVVASVPAAIVFLAFRRQRRLIQDHLRRRE